MRSLLVTLTIVLVGWLPAKAQGFSAADREAIAVVVQAQLDAFERDDANAAFGLASPSIQDLFRTAEGFLAMVRQAYAPVYRPSLVAFVDVVTYRDHPTQRVLVVGPDGRAVMAHYLMEQQPDGTWRIDGCILEPLPDIGA